MSPSPLQSIHDFEVYFCGLESIADAAAWLLDMRHLILIHPSTTAGRLVGLVRWALLTLLLSLHCRIVLCMFTVSPSFPRIPLLVCAIL